MYSFETDEFHGKSVKIRNCRRCYIYILLPITNVHISGCYDCTIVLGVVGGVTSIENSSGSKIITCSRNLQIRNCSDMGLNVLVNTPPLFLSDNFNIIIGPYNSFYSSLKRHLTLAKLSTKENYWNEPLFYEPIHLFANFENKNQLMEEFRKRSFSEQPLQSFIPFSIPVVLSGNTNHNPVKLPERYQDALERNNVSLRMYMEKFAQKHKLHKGYGTKHRVQQLFEEWLIESGNMNQILVLVKLQTQTKQL
eukprot:TRINITY_DN4502_c0_g1_i2.p1 TRINITY_DN4502_c0_g1~~TRINITY_DN4502_c0_g1_i2.p1  ORF type:complete len:251 (+),score=39.51 TRINITY_DN4502_c0_g1_i2:847-1599(+)